MAFKDIFVNAPNKTAPEVPEQVVGRIYHINKRGFGFIECKEIPHERIYFHWKALNHDTKRFAELVKGDEVEFTPKKYDEKKGWQAQRIKVLT